VFQYGIGGLFVNPVGGNQPVNPTPYELLTIMDVSVDISQELKELVGQNKFPDDIAPGQMKVSGKFSAARIDISQYNNIFFADTAATGVKQIVKDESHSIPSTGGYTIPVTNLATFIVDLGVRYYSTGAALTRTTGAVTTGLYSVSSGTYTFAAADEGLGVLISYVSTDATVGKTVQFNQQLMGYGPVFELWLTEPYQSTSSVPNGLHLYCCRLSKLGQALKNTDYLKPELDFSAFANAAGQVGEFFQTGL